MKYIISRNILSEKDFDDYRLEKNFPFSNLVNRWHNIKNIKNIFFQFFISIFPIISWIRQYDVKNYLKYDIISGLTVGVFNIPQGLAYARLANLPPVTGLYLGFVCPILYLLTGSSRHLSIGTFSVISLMVGITISSDLPSNIMQSENLLELDQAKYIVSATLTFLVGIIQIISSIFHFGFVTNFISSTVTNSFVFSTAIIVLTSQLQYLFGIKAIEIKYLRFSVFLRMMAAIFESFNSFNYVEFLIGLFSFILSLIFRYISDKVVRRFKIPFPGELFIIILSGIVSHFGKFQKVYNVRIVGNISSGIPGIIVPRFSIIPNLIIPALIISIVNYASSVSLAKGIAESFNHRIKYNNELFAYGFCNFVSSFFYCFVSGGSLSRSALQSKLGKTQITGLVSSILLLMVILFAAPLFAPLPLATLSAIIAVALINIFKGAKKVKELWLYSKFEFVLWIITCLTTVIFDLSYGLLTGITINALKILYNISWPKVEIVNEYKDTGIYKESNKFKNLNIKKNVEIIQFRDPLLYLNKNRFIEKSMKRLEILKKANMDENLFFIIDGKYWSQIDMEGIQSVQKVFFIFL